MGAASKEVEIEEEIFVIIAREIKRERSQITPDATLESLSLQSIDLIEIMMTVEERFGVYFPMDQNLSAAKNVGQLVRAVAMHIDKAKA